MRALKVGPWQERWSAKSGELAFRLVLNSFCATGRSLCSAARWGHWLPYGRSSVCNNRLSVHLVGLTHGQVWGARFPGLSFSGFCATGRSLCSAARSAQGVVRAQVRAQVLRRAGCARRYGSLYAGRMGNYQPMLRWAPSASHAEDINQ